MGTAALGQLSLRLHLHTCICKCATADAANMAMQWHGEGKDMKDEDLETTKINEEASLNVVRFWGRVTPAGD